MAEPADKGEAGGGGVPRLGRPPPPITAMPPPPKPGFLQRGLRCLPGPGQGRPRQLRARAPAPSRRPGRPFRLFNSIQLGLPARKLVSSDIQFN